MFDLICRAIIGIGIVVASVLWMILIYQSSKR